MPLRILLEGRPGVGKTTALRRLAGLLRDSAVSGFTTEEIRPGRTRVGFALETLAGAKAVLAHENLPGPPQVGRYGVDLGVLERLAVPALAAGPGAIVLIDELGQMELASSAFRDAVSSLFESGRDGGIVATVHARHDPFTEALRQRADVELLQVTPANRDRLPEELAARLTEDVP